MPECADVSRSLELAANYSLVCWWPLNSIVESAVSRYCIIFSSSLSSSPLSPMSSNSSSTISSVTSSLKSSVENARLPTPAISTPISPATRSENLLPTCSILSDIDESEGLRKNEPETGLPQRDNTMFCRGNEV